ncbi:MAG: DUF58 domain-containing protein [Candidatus Hydrogenedentota bacterium]
MVEKSFYYIKDLFSPDILYKLSRLDLKYYSTVRTLLKGQHISKSVGPNIEYAEHREYVPGDDIRRIDWKVLARQDRLSIKLQQEEESLPVEIFVDVSRSMYFPEKNNLIKKLENALFLGLGTGFVFLNKKDKVRIHFFSDSVFNYEGNLPLSFGDLCNVLMRVPQDEKSDFKRIFNQIIEFISPGSLIIFITDAITDEDIFIKGMKMIAGKDVVVATAHILSSFEIDLIRTKPVIYLDSEINNELNVDPLYIRENFKQRISSFIQTISSELRKNGCIYTFLLNENNRVDNLFKFLSNFVNQ